MPINQSYGSQTTDIQMGNESFIFHRSYLPPPIFYTLRFQLNSFVFL